MSEIVEKNSTCMWCHSHCAVTARVKDGRLIEVDANVNHPHAKLFTAVVRSCLRARAAAEYFYHPDRIHYPMKRVGERGEGKWQRITWNQALDEIAAKLCKIRDQYGPEAIVNTSGTGRTHDEFRLRFMNTLGSPNYIGQGNICHGPYYIVSCAIFGWYIYPLINSKTKCIFVHGGGIPMEYPPVWRAALNAIKNGAKLIVTDPRGIVSARRADVWMQLRPGTDTALIMGMINYIIQEKLYDKEFVDKWCYGFSDLAERASQYPLEKVSQITWVPVEQIKEAATMYATIKPASSIQGMGMEQLPNCVEALHAKFALTAITGNIDVPGGEVLQGPHPKQIPHPELEGLEFLSPEQRRKQIGSDRFKLLSLPGFELIETNVKRVWGRMCAGEIHGCYAHAPTAYRTMLSGKPYPLKAVITSSSNPLITQANTKLVYKALKSLDLYAVIDFFMTPSAEIADYVLPAATWLERPNIWDGFGLGKFISVSEAPVAKVVEGEYEHMTDFEFWRGLAVRMGMEKYWPWKSLEEVYDYRLAPTGYTLKELIKKSGGWDSAPPEPKKYETLGFGTTTGKIELRSTILEKLGYDPLPKYEEPPEGPIASPEVAKEYPYILITGGRFNPYYHSEHRQVDSHRKKRPWAIMQINPKTAAEHGISEGDWVWIETPRGRVRQKCEFMEGIDPRVVHAEHGWWYPEMPGEEPWLHGLWESNINVVTDDDPDACNPISGGWPLRTGLCKITKAKEYK
ncbi:MAG: molybdopterin-dependent oxidoreductase [Dehalococcoidia bacterium]|nr:molybdopterin-dependent oxidoreductase [Dehalococcoidia bacterium]